MKKVYAVIFFSFVVTNVWAQTPAESQPAKEPEVKEEVVIDKIKVFKAGKIELNGKEISLEDLKTELLKLKELNGEVWYYSDSSKGYPSNQAMKILRLILDNKIPYKLSTDPNFSDYARVGTKSGAENKENAK